MTTNGLETSVDNFNVFMFPYNVILEKCVDTRAMIAVRTRILRFHLTKEVHVLF